MNVMFKIAGEIVHGTAARERYLPGVTRDSMLQLLTAWGYEVDETPIIAVDDLMQAGHDGTMEEAFGTGYRSRDLSGRRAPLQRVTSSAINDFKTGELTQKLYDTLTGIQWGKLPDRYGWTVPVE